MNEVIYYPTFEVSDPRWLKFALIYLEKLNPIIPQAGDSYLSDQFQQIMGETDLIDIHRPNFEEGYSATLDAIDHLEKILQHPERYASLFGPLFLEHWRDPQSHVARLFSDKYTDEWGRFCETSGLGNPACEGLQINADVAMLYMTLLAQVIADWRGISPITDNPLLDRFAIFTRKPLHSEYATMQTAQAVITLELPENLDYISLEEVIALRNRAGFTQRLRAFHQELDAFMSNSEKGKKPGHFGSSLGSVWTDFREEILRLGLGLTGFSLGVWIALGAGSLGTIKAAQQIVGGLSLSVSSGIAIRNTWNHTKTKRFTRKYLADLGKIRAQ